MVMFGTVQAWISRNSKFFASTIALMLSCSFGQASETNLAVVHSIEDVQDASLVSLEGGYEHGFRNGMKLIAHGDGGIIAELIVLDVTKQYTQTLITELYGNNPLEKGTPVTIKTINFAAKWK